MPAITGLEVDQDVSLQQGSSGSCSETAPCTGMGASQQVAGGSASVTKQLQPEASGDLNGHSHCRAS